MSRQVLRVAVVGGGIGHSHIADGYVPNADRFAVTTICDINAERTGSLAREFGVPRQTASFDEVLAMPDLPGAPVLIFADEQQTWLPPAG